MSVAQLVVFAALGTGSGKVGPKVQPAAATAHPAQLLSGVANDDRERRYIVRYHRTRADEGIFADVVAANHGGIGTDGGTAPHSRGRIFIPATHLATRVDDIGEHHRRAEENIILAHHSGVNRHVVLHLHVPSQCHTGSNEHILTDVAALTQGAARHQVRKMPDFCARADVTARVNNSGGICKIILFHFLLLNLAAKVRNLDESGGECKKESRGEASFY